MTPPTKNLEQVVAVLKAHKFLSADEKELQAGIEDVLRAAGLSFEREVRLRPGDIIDFMVAPSLGIEVKTGGTLPALIRQCFRYCESERVGELLVVTARMRLDRLPREIHGKKCWVVQLMGAFG